jgi:Protein ChrB, N-terminal
MEGSTVPTVHNPIVQPRLQSSLGAAPRAQWVLLAYRLPREPSTPRIAIWRKLKRLGAAQLLDGLVALPLDSRNRERLEWLAEEVTDAAGEATIWVGELGSAAQERELAARMGEAAAGEYRAVIEEAAKLRAQAPGRRRRSLSRLRRELRRVRARDYFPPPERELARQAVEQLEIALEEAAA